MALLSTSFQCRIDTTENKLVYFKVQYFLSKRKQGRVNLWLCLASVRITEEKSFKSAILEVLNIHNKKIRDYTKQVTDWKERFGLLQKQKKKYQEEYRSIKKETENYAHENNNLKGEIDSLRQIVNRENRTDKCTACSSFQHTIQTLRDVYENTLTQKDNHIRYLETRIKELERTKSHPNKQNIDSITESSLSSPDSTCKYIPKEPNQDDSTEGCTAAKSSRKLMSHDQEEDSLLSDESLKKTDRGVKLRLTRNKKRGRYSEDPSPEQKRLRLDSDNTTDEIHQKDHSNFGRITGKLSNKGKINNKSEIVIPETCDLYADLLEDEADETCLEIDKNGGKTTVPHNVKCSFLSKFSDLDDRKCHRTVAMESSSSESEEENVSKVKGQKVVGVNINRSWLHGILRSPELDKNDIKEKKDNICQSNDGMRKVKSNPEYLLPQMKSHSRKTAENLSQNDLQLQVIPLKNHKTSKKNRKVDQENSYQLKSENAVKDLMEQSVSTRSEPEKMLKSPPQVERRQNIPRVTGSTAQQPIDILSDNESPLILRTSGRTNGYFDKQSFPEVDVLFEGSEESPTGKLLSKIEDAVRVQRSRSQEKSPEFSNSQVLRDMSKSKSGKKVLVVIDENEADVENKLRQTTLSQAFKTEQQTDSDLQQFLKEFSKGNQQDKTSIESKENRPPFKKPSVPKVKVKNKHQHDLDESVLNKSKRLPDFDMDETIAPSRFINQTKGNNCNHDRINGSLDPAIQLSEICGESQDLGNETEATLHTNKENNGSLSPDYVDNLDTLQDFRVEDLQRNYGIHNIPRTSTCVEFDDDSQGIPCSSTSVKFGSGKLKRQKRRLKTGDTEEPEIEETSNNRKMMEDSFDVCPKKPEPEYAYVDVVRGKEDRRKLKAFWCQECADYYKETGLSDQDIQKKMQECSRHRARFAPPSTPEHFWSVDFMDTPECEERGYINKENSEDKKKTRFKRKYGYKQLFKSKKDNDS